MDLYSGPERENPVVDYTNVSTNSFVLGKAKKIILDLERSSRICNGLKATIHILDLKTRCPYCTDALTGSRVVTNCKECNGTGFLEPYKCIGDYWTQMTVSPIVTKETEVGNIDNPGQKDIITVIGAQILKHGTLLYYPELDTVYKLIDVEPSIVALQGIVITQVAQASRLAKGAPEYLVVK